MSSPSLLDPRQPAALGRSLASTFERRTSAPLLPGLIESALDVATDGPRALIPETPFTEILGRFHRPSHGELVNHAKLAAGAAPGSPTAPRVSLTDDERRQSRRDLRYTFRDRLREITAVKRLRACGHWRQSNEAGVSAYVGHSILPDGGRGPRLAGFSGLQTCGSAWVCPVCAAKVRERRAADLSTLAEAHLEAGGGLFTFVLTAAHGREHTLAETWDAIRDSWRAVTSLRSWKAIRERYGVLGYVKSQEVTHGANGWHPHFHLMLLTEADLPALALAEIQAVLHRAWTSRMKRAGYAEPARHLLRVQRVRNAKDLASYLAKVDPTGDHSDASERQRRRVGWEAARSDLKGSRADQLRGLSPFEIGALAVAGSDRHRALWREFEKGSKGRACVYWSRGLRALYADALEPEKTDDELAEEQAVTTDTEWLHIEPASWNAVRSKPGQTATLLLIMESAGLDAGRSFVRDCLTAHVARSLAGLRETGLAYTLESMPGRLRQSVETFSSLSQE